MITLQDIVSHVMDSYDLSDNVIDVRRAMRSAVWGFEQATTRHRFRTFETEYVAYFNAAYSDGTIDIAADGTITLTGGTWPEWSALGLVYIDDERAYRVETRVDDTTIKLESWTGQTETGITYVLRQDRVILPDDVMEVYGIWQETEDWDIQIVDPMTFRDYDKPRIYTGADPYMSTFRSVMINGSHKTELRIAPGATTAVELNVSYTRRPRRPSVLVLKVASSVSEAVTLTSPIPLGTSVVGAVLRHGPARTAPTADIEFGVQYPSAATFEGVITEQASTTEFTVPGISDISKQAVIITDVLDMPSFLGNAVRLYAEAQMARIGRGDMRSYLAMQEAADEELRYAMEQDGPWLRRGIRPLLQVDRLTSTPYVVEVSP